MDYAERRRLKIMARAEIFDRDEKPELLAQLEMTDYRARIERVVVYHLEAFDWNCPQHITPRFTIDEIEHTTTPLRQRIAELEGKLETCECKES